MPGADSIERQAVKAAFEVHIEQGPVLEQRGKRIGVVAGVQNMCRYEVIVPGQEAHAGPTPMDLRRDPVRVLAEALPRLVAATQQHGREARFTVGIIETQPGSPNTVPGRLRFTIDLRHPEAERYRSLRAQAEQIVRDALAGCGTRRQRALRLGVAGNRLRRHLHRGGAQGNRRARLLTARRWSVVPAMTRATLRRSCPLR